MDKSEAFKYILTIEPPLNPSLIMWDCPLSAQCVDTYNISSPSNILSSRVTVLVVALGLTDSYEVFYVYSV